MRWALFVLMIGAGLAGCARQPDPEVVVLPAVYCYQTNGMSPDCYDHPIESEAHRLMGFYGPEPLMHGFYGTRSF